MSIDFVAARYANRIIDSLIKKARSKLGEDGFISHARATIYKEIKKARREGTVHKESFNFRSLDFDSCNNCEHLEVGQDWCQKHDIDCAITLGHICDDHKRATGELWI